MELMHLFADFYITFTISSFKSNWNINPFAKKCVQPAALFVEKNFHKKTKYRPKDGMPSHNSRAIFITNMKSKK